DENHIAFANIRLRRLQMLWRHHKIFRQHLQPGDLRNIDQHAAPENGRNRIDRKALEASRVALHARRFLSTMQPAVTTEVTERIDVRAHMRAQRDSLGSRTSATGI